MKKIFFAPTILFAILLCCSGCASQTENSGQTGSDLSVGSSTESSNCEFESIDNSIEPSGCESESKPEQDEESEAVSPDISATLTAEGIALDIAGIDGSLLGTDQELEIFNTTLSNLKISEVKVLVACKVMTGFTGECKLTNDEATELLRMIKSLKAGTLEEMENPYTGVGWDVYIETANQKFSIRFSENWLTAAIEGNENCWIFDSAPSLDSCYEIDSFLGERYVEPPFSGRQSDTSESESVSPSQSKITFTESDEDDRLQFTTSEEAVGDTDDLENCKNALNSSLDELGLLVLYSPADGPREYTDEFIEDILDIHRRTKLRTIDEIFEQDPNALTRGIQAAAFYDKEGNRVWVIRAIGNLVRIELGDDGEVHVFKGTLGCR